MKFFLSALALVAVFALPAHAQTHHTLAVITDITDPGLTDAQFLATHGHPRELWRGDNVMTACGMRNLEALALGLTTMGAYAPGVSPVPTPNSSLGGYCAGVDPSSGCTRVPCAFDSTTIVRIGSAPATNTAACTANGVPFACCTGNNAGCLATVGPYPCTGAGTPFPCCTASGVGCVPSAFDTQLFGEGADAAGAQADNYQQLNYVAFQTVNTGWNACTGSGTPFACCTGAGALSTHGCTEPTATGGSTTSTPVPFFNGTNGMGMQFVTTFLAGSATMHWCEYALESGSAGNTSTTQCGAVSKGSTCSTATKSRWLLNHAALSGYPCDTGKGSSDVWQITVTATWPQS